MQPFRKINGIKDYSHSVFMDFVDEFILNLSHQKEIALSKRFYSNTFSVILLFKMNLCE